MHIQHYLVSWKGYPEKKSTWKSFSAVMHFWKMISTFHKNHPEKPKATSLLLDSAPPMAKPSIKPLVKPPAKQKRGRLTHSTKQAKKWDIGQWRFSFLVLIRLESFFTNSVSFGSFTNSVSFGGDAHSASSSNMRVLPIYEKYIAIGCFIYGQHIATMLAIQEQYIAIVLSIYERHIAISLLIFLRSFPLG